MVNRKEPLAPFLQRADPPPSRPSPSSNENALPQTPIAKFRSRRSSKLQQQPLPPPPPLQRPGQTSMERNARIASSVDDSLLEEDQDSHDLSLTDHTRHSVVDNMLLSLNPDPAESASPPRDRPANYSSGSDVRGPPRHLHSSSTNSDLTFPSDSSPDRRLHQYGHGRRSNSSSNFTPSSLRPIDGGPLTNEVSLGRKKKIDHAKGQGAAANGSTATHARQSNSKGSIGSASIDYGQMSSVMQSPPGIGRRSASFDHGYIRRGFHSASNSASHPPVPSSFSRPLLYDDMEAAPTPTVPAGPRRDDAAEFPPAPGQMQRRNSNKSSKSQRAKKSKVDGVQWDTPASTTLNQSRRASKQMSSVPGLLRSRNGSPARQLSEPALSRRSEAGMQPKGTVTQKQGFFRRVFGSSKATAPNEGPPGQPAQDTSSQTDSPILGRNGTANNQKQPKPTAAEKDKSSNPSDLSHPPLHKKPSSFFRRRKKSMSETARPPLLALHVQPNATQGAVEPSPSSPVSSLRKVMNPYLDGPGDKPRTAGTMESSTSSQRSRLRGQKSHDPALASGKRSSIDIKPSQPRALPSQEEIAVAQRYMTPDAHLLTPEDASFPENVTKAEPEEPTDTPAASSSSRHPAPRSSSKGSQGHRPSSKENVKKTIDPVVQSVNSDEKEDRDTFPSAYPSRTSSKTLDAKNLPKRPSKRPPSPPSRSTSADRVKPRLETPTEKDRIENAKLCVEAGEMSPASDYHSASSAVHPLKAAGKDEVEFPVSDPKVSGESATLKTELSDSTRPTVDEVSQARLLFSGDEFLVPKETAAAWLGEPTPDRARVRQAYMELYNWQDLNILAALRDLCSRLYLKGEAQQVDRVLDAFSTRWCACNPNHGFKAIDVVHTICYSLLLLNTDLHQVEIETKMTRTQFLKNILPTIRRVVTDAAPDAFTNNRSSTMPPARPWAETSASVTKRPLGEGRRSFEGQRPSHLLTSRPSDQTTYTSTSQPHSQLDFASSAGDTGPLVKMPFHGKLSTWENQIEIVLKDFYTSVRQLPLPLHGSEGKDQLAPDTPQTTNSLSVMTSSVLRRTPSMLSKGSENVSYSRGRPLDGRMTTGRWQSKTRSRPRLYPASTVASSRRSSFDEQSSVTSPSIASAWSRFSSFGRTQTSFSVESFSSHFPQAEYQQSIGFANALSQAIIREENPTTGDDESLRAAPLLEDESLELAGAPWAKEGILKHKHHLEAVEKRAKDRNWAESFAVIEKGQMRLFSFTNSAKSLRQKAKAGKLNANPDGPVGGGNWADNAEVLGSFTLRHTIASALPPPGYSKARPHVWALSLPNGAVHLFQVGTPEIVKEFVTTANYWSARLSKEPLVGAISNIEYGWGDTVINTALLAPSYTDNSLTGTATQAGPIPQSSSSNNTMAVARPSFQSVRSARSSSEGGAMSSALRPKLPGDKVHINDWQPPQASMVASALMEVDQLKALTSYVKNVEEELSRHNELRSVMLLAFSPRHPNHTKAMMNWERKSSYLLREIVKFRTYMDCLTAAQSMKEGILAEKRGAAAASAIAATVDTTADNRSRDEANSESEANDETDGPCGTETGPRDCCRLRDVGLRGDKGNGDAV